MDDSQNRIHVRPQHPILSVIFQISLSQSSATPTTHKRPSSFIHCHRDAQAPPGSGAHAVVDRFLPRFRRPQSNIDTSIELQQRPMRNIISGHSGPAVVEVPEIRDKQVCLVSVFLLARKVNDFWVGIICCPTSGASPPYTKKYMVGSLRWVYMLCTYARERW